MTKNDDHGNSHDEHDEEESKLLIYRLVVIALMIIASLAIFIPYLSCLNDHTKQNQIERNTVNTIQGNSNSKNKCKSKFLKIKFFSLSVCFAAGMLISMSLCHILPESVEMYSAYTKSSQHEEQLQHSDDHAKEEDHHDHRRFLEEDDHHGEEDEGHDDHDNHGDEHGFPLPYLMFTGGFSLMLLLDQVLFKSFDVKE